MRFITTFITTFITWLITVLSGTALHFLFEFWRFHQGGNPAAILCASIYCSLFVAILSIPGIIVYHLFYWLSTLATLNEQLKRVFLSLLALGVICGTYFAYADLFKPWGNNQQTSSLNLLLTAICYGVPFIVCIWSIQPDYTIS